jgi:hypothetical protein
LLGKIAEDRQELARSSAALNGTALALKDIVRAGEQVSTAFILGVLAGVGTFAVVA